MSTTSKYPRKDKSRKPSKSNARRRNNSKSADKEYIEKECIGKDKPMGRIPENGADNDPNWYFTDSKLAEQASQLSFQQFLGGGAVMGTAEVPTVMTLCMNPSPGVSYYDADGSGLGTTYVRDGLNLMATKLYTLLSSYSGRTSNYAPQDVGTMILAIGEVASMIEYVRRIFGVAQTYNARNRAYPREIIRAMSIDADDLFDNLADYRMRMNTYITVINQIPLLDNIGYIRKCRDIYQKLYLDSPSSMAQTYVMIPLTTWIIDETSYSGGTILKTTPVYAGNPRTLADLMTTVIDPMIDALLQSSTLQIVYADLINLANKASYPMFKFDYIDENYVVIPEYNRYALLQIHNLNTFGAAAAPTFATFSAGNYVTPQNDVYPDANVNGLIYNPGFAEANVHTNTALGISSCKYIVDMDTDSPDLVDRIESLRFKLSLNGLHTYTESGNNYYIMASIPDHYCCAILVYGDKAGAATDRKFQCTTEWLGASASTLSNTMSVLTQFKGAPIFKIAAAGNQVVSHLFGELEYYTIIDGNYLSRLNRLMYTGLFDFRM